MKIFFTIIFFIVFSLLFTFVLLLGELKFYVLTPAFIKDPLRETQVYRKVVTNADQLSRSILKEQDPGVQEGLNQMPESAKALNEAVLKSVDEKWMEKEAEKAIDAFYAYATTDQPSVELTVDLRDFKTRFSKNLYSLMLDEYNKLPEVSIETFQQQMAQNPGQFPTTRPAGYSLKQTLELAKLDPLGEIMSRIPDKYDMSYTDKNQPAAMEGLAGFKQVKSVLNVLSIIFWILLALTILLLPLFAKLTGKSWMEFSMRLGIFLSSFLLPFIVFTVLWYVSVNILLVEGLARLDLPSLVIKQIFEPMAVYVISRVTTHILAWSGILGLTGLIMALGTGVVLRRKPLAAKPQTV